MISSPLSGLSICHTPACQRSNFCTSQNVISWGENRVCVWEKRSAAGNIQESFFPPCITCLRPPFFSPPRCLLRLRIDPSALRPPKEFSDSCFTSLPSQAMIVTCLEHQKKRLRNPFIIVGSVASYSWWSVSKFSVLADGFPEGYTRAKLHVPESMNRKMCVILISFPHGYKQRSTDARWRLNSVNKSNWFSMLYPVNKWITLNSSPSLTLLISFPGSYWFQLFSVHYYNWFAGTWNLQ